MNLSIIIPILNERKNISLLVSKIALNSLLVVPAFKVALKLKIAIKKDITVIYYMVLMSLTLMKFIDF